MFLQTGPGIAVDDGRRQHPSSVILTQNYPADEGGEGSDATFGQVNRMPDLTTSFQTSDRKTLELFDA